MKNTPPSSGYEFPSTLADKIDANLRSTFEQKSLRSVRPERQPLVVPAPTAPPATPHVVHRSVPNVPRSDAEGTSIDLPSGFAFYNFQDLYVRPFRVSHLAKLASAHQNANLQMLVETVSSVLATSCGAEAIAFRLTMADFNQVLYWLRLNSFGKPQMRVTARCSSSEHQARVDAGSAPDSSLDMSFVYRESDIQVLRLAGAPDPEIYHLQHGDSSIGLSPETMQDTIEFLDDPRMSDPEFQYLAKLASVIDVPGSLAQRVSWVEENLATDQIATIEAYRELIEAYGIEETVTTKCMECGASQQVRLAVDAPCFLSPEF